MLAMNGWSVVQITSVTPAEVMTTPAVKEMCAKKIMSAEQMENATHAAHTSLARGMCATRVTTMTIPMESAINTAL